MVAKGIEDEKARIAEHQAQLLGELQAAGMVEKKSIVLQARDVLRESMVIGQAFGVGTEAREVQETLVRTAQNLSKSVRKK